MSSTLWWITGHNNSARVNDTVSGNRFSRYYLQYPKFQSQQTRMIKKCLFNWTSSPELNLGNDKSEKVAAWLRHTPMMMLRQLPKLLLNTENPPTREVLIVKLLHAINNREAWKALESSCSRFIELSMGLWNFKLIGKRCQKESF